MLRHSRGVGWDELNTPVVASRGRPARHTELQLRMDRVPLIVARFPRGRWALGSFVLANIVVTAFVTWVEALPNAR